MATVQSLRNQLQAAQIVFSATESAVAYLRSKGRDTSAAERDLAVKERDLRDVAAKLRKARQARRLEDDRNVIRAELKTAQDLAAKMISPERRDYWLEVAERQAAALRATY